MSLVGSLAVRLAATIGWERVVNAEEELASYAVDALTPGAIARPASAGEVAEVVRFAVREGVAVLPLGSRSKCDMGMPPTRYDIAIDMTGLCEIAHYDAGDLTLSVDAGMSLREMEVFLRQSKQFLPLAVPCFESTTAGGTVASGIDSAYRHQYGSARNFLLGAEFVDGTGQLCKSGGRVVKNVTGYDLHKLLIGSLGTLGVITRLNFRTYPMPEVSRGHLANFADCESALKYWKALDGSGLPFANLEMLSPPLAKMMQSILKQRGNAMPEGLKPDDWSVYSSFEGNEAVVRRVSGDLEKIAKKAGCLRSEILETSADESLGGMLREVLEWLRWGARDIFICRVTVPNLNAGVLSELAKTAEEHGLRWSLLLRAAGVIYFAGIADSEDRASLQGLTRMLGGIKTIAWSHKGHSSVLHAPHNVKPEGFMTFPEDMDGALQMRVKEAFDPYGVFATGRVVGGF